MTELGELLPAASAMFVIPIVSSLAKHDPAEADTIQVLEIVEPPVSRVGHLCFIIPHAKSHFMSGRSPLQRPTGGCCRVTGNTEVSRWLVLRG
jgi:hypothetical protein